MNYVNTADLLCDGGVGSCSHECAIVDGKEQCFCPVGMELSPDDLTVCVGEWQLSVHESIAQTQKHCCPTSS